MKHGIDAASCPCRVGEPPIGYVSCCGRFHRAPDLGAASLVDPRDLVRARFSAFALGLVPFLSATQSKTRDPIGGLDPRTRYKRLELLDSDLRPPSPRVLFAVDVLFRGVDASFVELSSFAFEDGRLVYVVGISRSKRLGQSLAPLSIEEFEARAR